MMSKPKPTLFAVVDIETTGGMKTQNCITEIAIALFDGSEVIEEFQSLVRPSQSIPPFITQLTGITNEMVEDAPYFHEIAKKVVEITEGAIFVAHNVGFDYGFIRQAFEDLGYTYTRKKLCTAKLARRLLPELRRHNLDTLISHYKLRVANRHRAMDDVKATVHVLKDLLQKQESEKTLKEFVDFGVKVSQIPAALDIDELHALPESCGLYFLYGENDHLLYVGKSKDIKKRIFQHFRSHSNKSMKFLARVVRIDYELTGSEMIALIKEDQLIKSLKPEYNSAQRQKNWKYAIVEKDHNLPVVKSVKHLMDEDTILAWHTYKHQAHKQLSSVLLDVGICLCKINGLIPFEDCDFSKSGQCESIALPDEKINKRIVQKFRSNFDEDMIVVDHGRHKEENSFVYVTSGEVDGWAYLSKEIQITDPGELENYKNPIKPAPQYNKFVKNHISKYAVKIIIE